MNRKRLFPDLAVPASLGLTSSYNVISGILVYMELAELVRDAIPVV